MARVHRFSNRSFAVFSHPHHLTASGAALFSFDFNRFRMHGSAARVLSTFFSSAAETRLHIGMDKWMGTKWEFYSSIKARWTGVFVFCESFVLRNLCWIVIPWYYNYMQLDTTRGIVKLLVNRALSKPKLKDFNTMEKNMSGI